MPLIWQARAALIVDLVRRIKQPQVSLATLTAATKHQWSINEGTRIANTVEFIKKKQEQNNNARFKSWNFTTFSQKKCGRLVLPCAIKAIHLISSSQDRGSCNKPPLRERRYCRLASFNNLKDEIRYVEVKWNQYDKRNKKQQLHVKCDNLQISVNKVLKFVDRSFDPGYCQFLQKMSL